MSARAHGLTVRGLPLTPEAIWRWLGVIACND
jgi:hypothetical protein